jgi:hypothetical protein
VGESDLSSVPEQCRGVFKNVSHDGPDALKMKRGEVVRLCRGFSAPCVVWRERI